MSNAYITVDYSNGLIAVLNSATNTVSTNITLSNNPLGIVISSDGNYLYTAGEGNNTVGVTDLTTSSPSTSYISLASGAVPQNIAVSPDGSQVWVTDEGNNTISIVSGGSVTHTISLSSKPGAIAFTPDGNYVYVPINSAVNIYSTGSTPSLAHTVSLSYVDATAVAISADGSHAYVANYDTLGHNYLVVISTSSTPSIVTSIAVGNVPCSVAVRPNSNEVYVLNNGSSTVSVIDASTYTVTATISSAGGDAITFTPDGVIAYNVNVSAGSVLAINAITHVVTSIKVNTSPGVYTFGVTTYGSTRLPPSSTGYITNSGTGTVYVINLITQDVLVQITVGTEPIGVAFSPNGLYVFVVNYTSGTVSVISTATNTVIETITVGTNPFGIAISSNSNNVYVANQGSNSISIINAFTYAVTTITTGVGSGPTGIVVSPDNTTFYVTNYSGGTVSIFSAATGSLITTVTVGTNPCGIAITPDGTKVFVANQGSNSISVINTSTYAVTTFTTGVGSQPFGMAISPDGTRLYVSNYGGGTVSIFNTSTNALVTTVTVGTNPYGLSFSPDGATVYVSNYGSNSISVISTSSHTVTATIPFLSGNNPAAFGQSTQPASIPMTSIYTAPQGRLTLTSNTPVMISDVPNATSVYYTPYQGNIVPIYDGTNTQSYTFSQLTMTLNTSNHLSGKIYDLFIFLNSGVVTIGAGPAWSSTTSRGTGSGTTQLQQVNGLWVNANSINLTNGSTSYSSVPISEASYIGSMYMIANGQTAMQFNPTPAAGGSNNYLGVYNAYNRVSVISVEQDSNSTASWNYSTAAWRAADGNTNNSIHFIDGLQQSYFNAMYSTVAQETTSGAAYIGIGLNISNNNLGTAGAINYPASGQCTPPAFLYSSPLLGLNYVTAVEYAAVSTYFGQGVMKLFLNIDM